MAVVREADLFTSLKRMLPGVVGLLVYGGDDARVSSLSEQSLKSIANSEDVTRLSVSALRSDPALLDDALRSQSFLGGKQVVVVDGVTDSFANLLETFLLVQSELNFLVLTAGSLSKSSALRRLCEAATNFLVVAVYEDRPSDVLDAVAGQLRRDGLIFGVDAAERFMALCGSNRQLALKETEKLVLYCAGQVEVSAHDVVASCGDQSSYGLDSLIDAALSGDSLAVDRMLHTLDDNDWRSVLPIVSNHVSRLTGLRVDVERLGGTEAAFRTAKPPVFFGRKAALSQQLRAFDVEALVRVQVAIEAAVEQTRHFSDLAPELVSRLLLSLAAEARRGLRS